jgi:hypothetical protein
MREGSLNPDALGAASAAIHLLERSDHMNRSINRRRRFAQRCLVVLAAAAIPLVSAQTPSSAAPWGGPSSPVDASKVLGQYERPNWPLVTRLANPMWCQPGNDGRLHMESFSQRPDSLRFDVNVLECRSTWFDPKLGASKLTDGIVQLEISGPESWTSKAQPASNGVYWSEYFDWAPVGTYTVRAKVQSLRTGTTVYSNPLTVEKTFQGYPFFCESSEVGTRSMKFLVESGHFGVTLTSCSERVHDGPRPVFVLTMQGSSDVELTLIDPEMAIDVTFWSREISPSYAFRDSLPPGSYLFQARYTGPDPIVEPVVTRWITKTSDGRFVDGSN